MYQIAIGSLNFISFYIFQKNIKTSALSSVFVSLGDYYLKDIFRFFFKVEGFDNSHILSRASIYYNVLSNANPIIKYTVPVPLALVTDDFLDLEGWLETPIKAFSTMNSMFNNNSLPVMEEWLNSPIDSVLRCYSYYNENEYLQNYSKLIFFNILNSGANLYFQMHLSHHFKGIFLNNMVENSATIIQENHGFLGVAGLYEIFKNGQDIKIIATKILLHSLLINAVKMFFNNKIESVETDLRVLSYEKAIDDMMDKNNSIKVISQQKSRELLDHYSEDVFQTHSLSIQPIVNSFKNYMDFTQALFLIERAGILNLASVNNYLAGIFILNAFKQFIYKNISADMLQGKEKSDDHWRKTENIMNHFSHHTKDVIRSDSNEFMKKTIFEYLETIKEPLSKVIDFNFYNSLLIQGMIHIDDFLSFIMLHDDYINEVIDFKQLNQLMQSHIDFMKFVNGRIASQERNIELSIHLGKAQEFLNIISMPPAPSASRVFDSNDKIIFENYKLYLEDDLLTYVNHLELPLGLVYSITGASGAGKSTTIDNILFGLFHPLSSTGIINLPLINGVEATISSFQKHLYIPSGKTLLEVILSPKKLSDYPSEEIIDVCKLVMDLLNEMKFSHDSDNSKQNTEYLLNSTDFSLSGGQQQKIAIIQAILRKPDIIFLDETFTGLDGDSLQRMQRVIEDYLVSKGTTVFVVDHEAHNHNHNDFFDKHIYFSADEGIIFIDSLEGEWQAE